jgi:HSP20 family protein
MDTKITKSEKAPRDLGFVDPAWPFPLLRHFSRDLDYVFSRLRFAKPLVEMTAGFWSPDVEVFERGKEVIVRVDLPGLTKDDITVDIAEGFLTLKGERKYEREDKEKGFYRCERNYGTFYRAIPLPDGVDFERAKAVFKNGVLEVAVPLIYETSKPHRLEIIEEKPTKTAA